MMRKFPNLLYKGFGISCLQREKNMKKIQNLDFHLHTISGLVVTCALNQMSASFLGFFFLYQLSYLVWGSCFSGILYDFTNV